MGSLWPPLFFVIGIIASVTSSPFYTVVAPEVVRPNSDYHVAISTYELYWLCRVHIKLTAELDSGESYNVSETTTVLPGTTHVIKLETGETTPGRYKLIAQGLSGITFYNTTDLQYVHKSHSIFIQTDRAIYKPGNKVFFRVLVLDSKLHPVQNGTELVIHVTDGQGNRVKQWKQQMDSKGVFSGEIQLSDQPVLGDWKIVAIAFEQTVEKIFEVAEYVLPKFEVAISVPKDATYKDSVIPVTITAKYTYGKPVKGEATIAAYPDVYSDIIPPTSQPAVRKVVPIDGTVTVNFDISDLRLQGEWERPIQFTASVEEELTGRSQNTSAKMTLYIYKYTIELLKTAESYKPGLKFTVFIKIAHHDGSPVQDQCNPVQILYGFSYEQSSHINVTRNLDDHGMIQLDIYPPLTSDTIGADLYIEAEYLGLHQWFPSTPQAVSPSGSYIQAVLKTENPMVGNDVKIKVNSTVPLKYLSYEVLGRGDILEAATVEVTENKATAKFRFLATYLMAPTAHVIVYYMRDDGEIVADALNVPLNGTLQNFVDITITPQETQPGANVDLTITSNPNSHVGLLGVDQSSILLKSGNDISREQVENELRSYDASDESFPSDFMWGRSFWSPGSTSAFDVFDKSGVVVFTNGIVYEKPQPIYWWASAGGGAGGGGGGGGVDGGPIFMAMENSAMGNAEMELGSTIESSPIGQPQAVKVRKDFPETWIWQMVDAGSDGKTVLNKTVPDTITSWVLTAFAVDDVYGFGLIDGPRKLTVFQPFFMSLDLPYSVIRGEIVAIPIVVFNYMDKPLIAEVVLENGGQFVFAEATNDVSENPKLEPYRKKTIEVEAASGTSVSFLIIPKELGYIPIKVTASSALAGDSIEQQLLVKPEGETQYVNKAIFIDLRNSKAFETSVPINIPENSVPGSEHVEVSAVGDILGTTLPNLANLLRMPYGCGEQNMLNFVPNIVVLNYLKSTNRLTPEIEGKALNFLQVGYQQELTYRHNDGSFSAFGMSDARGSTWLTAFVAKSFIQAAGYITIEERIIKTALQWLVVTQSPEGSFPEVGTVHHQDMQGGAAKGLALTAFTLIAFLENPAYISEFRSTIDKGVGYIVQNLKGLDDIYSICLCAYVLNLAQHPEEETVFGLMQSKAQRSGEYKWWSKPVPEGDTNPWRSVPNSVNVEMTSYAMLTYLQRNMVVESLPIMKWLVTQRNADGGFASTQDTVIGIYALAKLAEKLSSGGSMDITFRYENGGEVKMNITAENNMILQKQDLPSKTREVNISATGDGFAICQVSWNYNLDVDGDFPLFTLNPHVDKNSDVNHLQLSICTGFIPTKEANASNMAVMEVSFPSGFALDLDSLPSLKTTQYIKRVETKNGDTIVVLYFDKLLKEEYCPTISAYRAHKVAKQKPVPVTVFDYYDLSRRATVFYEPIPATFCDVCEGEDCGNECKI